METVEVPGAGTLVIVDGELPSDEEWGQIQKYGWTVNVLSLPGRSDNLDPLRPYFGFVERLAINSSSVTHLDGLVEMPHLHVLAIGGAVHSMIDGRKLVNLEEFDGPVESFEGITDLPGLRRLGLDWPRKAIDQIGAPLETLRIRQPKGSFHLPLLSHPRRLNLLRLQSARLVDLTDLEPFQNLEELVLDGCRSVVGSGVLLKLRNLKRVVLDDCPDIEDWRQLLQLNGVETMVVGRNPFTQSFRDAAVELSQSEWSFPPGAKYLPVPNGGVRKEYLVHPGLAHARTVPDEASETMPWEDALTDEWQKMSDRDKRARWDVFLGGLFSWALAEGVDEIVQDGLHRPVRASELVTSRPGDPSLKDITLLAKGVTVLEIPGDLDEGVYVISTSPFR